MAKPTPGLFRRSNKSAMISPERPLGGCWLQEFIKPLQEKVAQRWGEDLEDLRMESSTERSERPKNKMRAAW